MKKSSFLFAVLLLVILFAAASVPAGEKPAAKKEAPKGLSALVVKIKMKAEFREQFLKEMWADAIGSEKKEPGCLMFNIVNDNADPNTLYLFEVYKDDKAVEAHKKMPHFTKWLETTKNWLAAPLEITPCTTIYPPAAAWQKRTAPKK
ncbi:MAG TPA: putative quinol monooxygenase [Geobacteraceae bacterium]|nr:putative quinol monooxygenase [Geobacteraceae bacterium]